MIHIALLYVVTIIVCTAASCPCHIPCTGKPEVCTCFGTPGDDGYACKSHGDDYEFLSQSKSSETEWIVQCARKSVCSKRSLLDDSNPFAAYELRDNNVLQAFDDDNNGKNGRKSTSSAHSSKWFGGNWFDFWGKNEDQFFIHEDEAVRGLKAAANEIANAMVLDEDELDGDSETTKMKSDFDDISIDNHDTDAFTISDSKDSKSTSRSLKHSDSELSGWSELK